MHLCQKEQLTCQIPQLFISVLLVSPDPSPYPSTSTRIPAKAGHVTGVHLRRATLEAEPLWPPQIQQLPICLLS